MKKTSLIFISVLLSVFCLSSVSYSESNYDKLFLHWSKLKDNFDMMSSNNSELSSISRDFDWVSKNVLISMWTNYYEIRRTISFSTDLLDLMSVFGNKCECNNETVLRFIKEKLSEHQSYIKTMNNSNNRKYDSVKKLSISHTTKASISHIVDKQRVITQSSLKTLERTQELLEKMILENKMKELNKKHKSK